MNATEYKAAKTLGFMGLGTMGFPICYGLAKSGFKMVLPTYRRDVDQKGGFSPKIPDEATKSAMYDEMLANGAVPAADMAALCVASDVILISMPTSRQVEMLVNAPDGILANAKPGTVVLDLTSADPNSTRKLAKTLAEKDITLLDCPISGGAAGAFNQTLSVMVGGDEAVFEASKPVLETLGDPAKIFYVGPSGAGDTLKSANNFLSACCTAATTEALMVCAKAGIDPRVANKVISVSGGKSDASMRKYPQTIFAGKRISFAMQLMLKDIHLFNLSAKEFNVPNFFGNTTYQVWNIPAIERGGQNDSSNLIDKYEEWCGVKVSGLDADDANK